MTVAEPVGSIRTNVPASADVSSATPITAAVQTPLAVSTGANSRPLAPDASTANPTRPHPPEQTTPTRLVPLRSEQGLQFATVGGTAPTLMPLESTIERMTADLPPIVGTSPEIEARLRSVAGRLATVMNDRTARLSAGARTLIADAPPPNQVLGEDLSERPHTIMVGLDGTDMALHYAKGLQRVGVREGFDVLVNGASEDLQRAFPNTPANANVRRFAVGNPMVWPEDSVLPSRDGGFRLTPLLSAPSSDPDKKLSQASIDLVATQIRDRMQRQLPGVAIPPLQTEADLNAAVHAHPEVNYEFQGAVNRDSSMLVAGAIGILGGRGIDVSNTYVEGGNLLSGRRTDGSPYALIGADTLAINRHLLANQPGGPMTDDETRRLIARDVGVTPENLIVTRQPGAFHIDMAMAGWERGTVLLNDARAAYATQVAGLRAESDAARPRIGRLSRTEYEAAMSEWQKARAGLENDLTVMGRVARNRAVLEDGAAADLTAAGLRVVRVPGRYMRRDAPQVDVANLINGEGGTGRTGQFFVTAGAPSWAQQAFLRAVDAGSHARVTVYFATTRDDAEASLQTGGSMNCRSRRIS